MVSRFASVTEEQILSINEAAVPKNTKMVTKFGLTVFNEKLFNFSKLIILWRKKLQYLVYMNCRVLRISLRNETLTVLQNRLQRNSKTNLKHQLTL